MSNVIEMPGSLADLEILFEVMELLDNRAELIKEFQPEAVKLIVKDSFFTGVFRKKYEEAWDDLIVSLIKQQIMKHFTKLTPEEILLICDKEFLKMITEGFYFDKKQYINNEQDIKLN